MKPEAEPEEAEMEVLKLKLKSRRRYDFEYRIFTGSDANFFTRTVQIAAAILAAADAAVGSSFNRFRLMSE